MITVSPKGSTVEQLSLGNKYSTLKINNDEGFTAYIDVTSDDRWIELNVNRDNKAVSSILNNQDVSYYFIENNNRVATVSFDKNGINVDSSSGRALGFYDKTNNLNVTFTVAELIALKALLQTT